MIGLDALSESIKSKYNNDDWMDGLDTRVIGWIMS